MTQPTKREFADFGWRVVGFGTGAIALLVGLVLLAVIGTGDSDRNSPAVDRSRPADPSGGDALQPPFQGGQQPAPAPAGGREDRGEPEGGGKPSAPRGPSQPTAAPTPSETAPLAPRPALPPPVPSPPSSPQDPDEPPGLLKPAVDAVERTLEETKTRACTAADRLADLC